MASIIRSFLLLVIMSWDHGVSLISSRLVNLFKGHNARSHALLTPFTDSMEMTEPAAFQAASARWGAATALQLKFTDGMTVDYGTRFPVLP